MHQIMYWRVKGLNLWFFDLQVTIVKEEAASPEPVVVEEREKADLEDGKIKAAVLFYLNCI